MAVTTDVGVINLALTRCGQGPTPSRAEGTAHAKAADLVYDDARDAVFRQLAWHTLISRVQLVISADPNLSTDMLYMYTLPADFIRALDINGDPDKPFRIEGQYFYCNVDTPCILRYVRQETNVANWDPLLLEAVVLNVAYRIAYRIDSTKGLHLVAMLQQEYILVISAAVRSKIVEQREDPRDMLLFLQENSPLLLLGKNYVSE